MATVLEHKVFSKTDLQANNNKFWKIWFYDNGEIETQNGRQGLMGQRRFITATGRGAYEAKLREKRKKGYVENDVVEGVSQGGTKSVAREQLKDIAVKQIKHSNPLVQQLIDFLVKINAHNIFTATKGKISYDTSTAQFKTAVGVISSSQVDRARVLLSDLSDMVAKGEWDKPIFEENLNEYLSLVPRAWGMGKRSPQSILPTVQTCQQENDLLDGLATSFAGVISQPKKKTKKKDKDTPQVFNVELSIVDDKKILSMIKRLYQLTRKSMHQSHNLSVSVVYSVDISSMRDAFMKYGAKLKDVRQLWHGTKASNLLSILKGGLIIPPSSSPYCTGRMYSDGVYFSSISTKALNYATNFWGGGGNIDRTFMFLADVAMGKYFIADGGWKSYPRPGYDSTWAKGGVSGVINDEMIVYRLDQANLIYLVEFVPRKRY